MDDLVALMAELLPDGWEYYEPDMGIESLLEAPCGAVIERDGTCYCPEQHTSPLIRMGLV